MNRSERAKHYFERLSKSSNPKSELEKILREIDGLVWSSTNKPLDEAEKILIIEALEKLIKESSYSVYESRSEPGLEKIQKGVTSASDNSDILDVISAIKRSKGGK